MFTIEDALRYVGAETGPGQIRCPFHGAGGERHRSARVYETSVHCFTCNKSWDAIGMIAEYHSVSRVEARRIVGEPVAVFGRASLDAQMGDALMALRRLPLRDRAELLTAADDFLLAAAQGGDPHTVSVELERWFLSVYQRAFSLGLPGGQQ